MPPFRPCGGNTVFDPMPFVKSLLLICLIAALCGCAEKPLPPGEPVEFSMGDVRIRMEGPQGYQSASWALPLAARWFVPPENLFALFLPAGQDAAKDSEALRRLKQVIISARPEFMNSTVEEAFFQAMCRDFIRVQRTFSPEFLDEFRRIAGTHYQGPDAFSHSLGVFHHTDHSVSMARIARQAGSARPGGTGAGAIAVAAQGSPEAEDEEPAASLQEWAEEYFAGVPHSILIQNVLLLGGRCINIHFSAPLVRVADIHALMEETRRYMAILGRD